MSERSVDLCQRTITSRSDPRGHALWATSDMKLEPALDRPYLDMTLCLVETQTFSSLFFFFPTFSNNEKNLNCFNVQFSLTQSQNWPEWH